MKIREAKQIYSSQLDALWSRQREIGKLLKEDGENGGDIPKYDRLELSRELSQVEKQYEKTQTFMDQLTQRETLLHNAEVSRQQGEAMEDAMEDMIMCMEIMRRISSGAKVPAIDEKKLMEYSPELYMSAKNMAVLNAQRERKEYDALTEEEEPVPEDARTPSEIAGDAEVRGELPEVTMPEPTAELP